MASEYEKIQSARELVRYVSIHGLSTHEEDIARAQDILGHTTLDELDMLANDIGRDDENGNPDPNGTWFGGRRGTKGTFYFILFHVWNWEDATRFWNQHSNTELKETSRQLRSYEAQINEMSDKLKAAEEEIDMLRKTAADMAANAMDAARERDCAREAGNKYLSDISRMEDEIVHLKARLYDLIS